MNKKAVCFSEYKVLSIIKNKKVKLKILNEINKIIEENYFHFVFGLSDSIDFIGAEAVIDKKSKNKNIMMEVVIPYKKKLYNYKVRKYIKYCDIISLTSNEYYDGCINERDRQIINISDLLVMFCTENPSDDNFILLKYAKENRKDVKIILV